MWILRYKQGWHGKGYNPKFVTRFTATAPAPYIVWKPSTTFSLSSICMYQATLLGSLFLYLVRSHSAAAGQLCSPQVVLHALCYNLLTAACKPGR